MSEDNSDLMDSLIESLDVLGSKLFVSSDISSNESQANSFLIVTFLYINTEGSSQVQS